MSKPTEEKENIKGDQNTTNNSYSNNTINSDADLKKALTFLMSKEMKEYSLEKRKEFLLKKLPSSVVEKAIDLYQTIETSVNKNIDEIMKNNKEQNSKKGGFLSSLYDLGILSTVLLSSLGINYLLDLNRNKKNEMFYREVEKKLNDELAKNTKEMKNEINSQLLEYVPANTFKNEINNQIVEFTQQRGLSLNLSSKSLREDISDLKKSMETVDKKLKDVNVKIENSNLLMKQEMVRDLQNMIEENNKKILIKIIENQNKLLAMTNEKITNLPKSQPETEKLEVNAINSNQIEKKSPVENAIPMFPNTGVNIRSLRLNPEITPTYYETDKQDFKSESPVANVNKEISCENLTPNILQSSQEESSFLYDPQPLLESVLSSVEKDNDKFYLIKQLKNQLSRIYEMSKDKKIDPYYVNLTNKIFQKASSEKLKEFLLKSGFKAESGSKLVFDVSRSEDLEKANLVIEEFENKLGEK
jgi:hypothetical protein